eukprot:3804720-Rhodomonas_salina.2
MRPSVVQKIKTFESQIDEICKHILSDIVTIRNLQSVLCILAAIGLGFGIRVAQKCDRGLSVPGRTGCGKESWRL